MAGSVGWRRRRGGAGVSLKEGEAERREAEMRREVHQAERPLFLLLLFWKALPHAGLGHKEKPTVSWHSAECLEGLLFGSHF